MEWTPGLHSAQGLLGAGVSSPLWSPPPLPLPGLAFLGSVERPLDSLVDCRVRPIHRPAGQQGGRAREGSDFRPPVLKVMTQGLDSRSRRQPRLSLSGCCPVIYPPTYTHSLRGKTGLPPTRASVSPTLGPSWLEAEALPSWLCPLVSGKCLLQPVPS